MQDPQLHTESPQTEPVTILEQQKGPAVQSERQQPQEVPSQSADGPSSEPLLASQLSIISDYFPLPYFDQSTDFVKGQCPHFISQDEQDERGLDQFEKYPFKPMAKYFRNQIYTNPKRIRTPEVLYDSLQYLKSTFFVTLLEDKKKIQKIIQNNSKKSSNLSDPVENAKRLEKILSIIAKQSKLGLVQQNSYDSFQVKKGKTKTQNQEKMKNVMETKVKLDRFLELLLPQKILVFLETRLQAIRCELYAQAIVYPKLVMDLLKCQIFLHTLKENQYSGVGSDINSHKTLKLVGLDTLLDQNIQQILASRSDFLEIYNQALTIAIFRYNTPQLNRLLDTHEAVLQNPKLYQLLQLRLHIERGNYNKYFTYLREQNETFILCLLLTHLETIRKRLCDVLKSTKIDVKKGWLAILLGLKIKPEQENLIINLNKNSDYVKEKQEKDQIESRVKQIKNWIKLQDLFDQLIITEPIPPQSELKLNDP